MDSYILVQVVLGPDKYQEHNMEVDNTVGSKVRILEHNIHPNH